MMPSASVSRLSGSVSPLLKTPLRLRISSASLVVERLFDGLVLLLFLLPALLSPAFGPGESEVIRRLSVIGAAGVGVGLAAVWLLARFPDRLLALTRWLSAPLPERATHRLVATLDSFVDGLGALGHPRVFGRVLAWSVLVWAWNGLSFWLGFLAFDIGRPGPTGALFLQSIVGFAVSIPSSPGFFGPFEAAARLALSAYGVEAARIVSFAAGYHVLTFIPVTLLGLWYAHRLGITWSEVEHSEEYVEAAVEREGD